MRVDAREAPGEVGAIGAAGGDVAFHLAALAQVPGAVVALDTEGRVLVWNHGAERLFGWTADEVMGRRVPFVIEERAAAFELRHREALAATEIPTVVVTHRRKDGVELRVNVQRAVMRDDKGAPLALVGILTDVTEELREQAERLRKEMNFRALIERAPDAILVHRLGFFVYANARAATLLGFERAEDLIGTRVLNTVHPDDRPLVLERMRHIASDGKESALAEVRQLRRDGTTVFTEVLGLPIIYDGEPATLVHMRDVTHDRELEAQLRIADRLASVGRLAAGVGHEINNPLTYVICNLDAVDHTLEHLGETGVRTVKELLVDVRHGVDRVRRIARDLSILSRGETDDRGFVDVRRVLDMCSNMASHEVKHRARLVTAYEDVPLILSNEPRLAQIFLNLIINAAHAIAPGDTAGNSITLRTRATDSHVVVEVADTGSGIPPGIIGRVFDPFFTTKDVGAGTGLGLSICQGLIAALGGIITLESDGVRGTTARVMHPIAR